MHSSRIIENGVILLRKKKKKKKDKKKSFFLKKNLRKKLGYAILRNCVFFS